MRVAMGLGAMLGIAIMVGCQRSDATAPPPIEAKEEPQPAPAPPPPKPSPFQQALTQVMQVNTLPQAIEMLRPMMTDVQGENMDPGAALLAVWALQKQPKWEDLQAIPPTKYGLVMKDPESERGERLCARGSIVQIQVERSEAGTLHHGVFFTNQYKFIRYSVWGSTGELVEESRAKLCGVVTGTSSYANVQGGVTHSVYVVGMFDLPANRLSPKR